jgi:5-methylcytosine-specific restriction endonuclease McrA
MQMYRRVRSIQSVKANPGGDIAATFKALMTEYITRHEPERKGERRVRRKEAQSEALKARTRYIPVDIKRAVLKRDDHRCTYVGIDGVRCQATQFLQFDHIVPYAKGGESTPDNLRLLCAAHNQLEAKDIFGSSMPDRIREIGYAYGAVARSY